VPIAIHVGVIPDEAQQQVDAEEHQQPELLMRHQCTQATWQAQHVTVME